MHLGRPGSALLKEERYTGDVTGSSRGAIENKVVCYDVIYLMITVWVVVGRLCKYEIKSVAEHLNAVA